MTDKKESTEIDFKADKNWLNNTLDALEKSPHPLTSKEEMKDGHFQISYTLAVKYPTKETLKELEKAKEGMQELIIEVVRTMKVSKLQFCIIWLLTRFVSRRIEPYKVTYYFTFL